MVLPLFVVVLLLLVVLPLLGAAVWTLLTTLLSGLVIGALGRLVVPGRQPLGCFLTSLVGVAGSLLGAVAGRLLHLGGLGTLVLEVAAAAVLVLVLVRRPHLGRSAS